MMHRKATVVMIGACMLLVAVSGVGAHEFYAEGQADTIEGADNLGKTIVHYMVVLGLPVLSAGMMAGGIIKMRRDSGSGGGMLGAGVGAGYLATIVNGLHTDAASAVTLVPLGAGGGWPLVAWQLALQASVLAGALLYTRRRARWQDGSAAAASLTSP